MQPIREELQDSLWESGDDYILKTDEEIIEILSESFIAEIYDEINNI